MICCIMHANRVLRLLKLIIRLTSHEYLKPTSEGEKNKHTQISNKCVFIGCTSPLDVLASHPFSYQLPIQQHCHINSCIPQANTFV